MNFAQLMTDLKVCMSKEDYKGAKPLLNDLQRLTVPAPILPQLTQVALVVTFALKDWSVGVPWLQKLHKEEPTNLKILEQLSQLYLRLGEAEKITATYQEFLNRYPKSTDGLFNYAYFLTKLGQFEQAIAIYRQTIEVGLKDPEEAQLNIANIYSAYLNQESLAITELESILAKRPDYVPALINLASLYEQKGQLQTGRSLLLKALKLEPNNSYSYARLFDITKITDADKALLTQAESLFKQMKPSNEQAELAFGLGKAFNDLLAYDKAGHYYFCANEYLKQVQPRFERTDFEQFITTNREKLRQLTVSDNQAAEHVPVFICGMFRSGSTLLEQMVAQHSDITSCGENPFITNLFNNSREQFFDFYLALDQTKAEQLAIDYFTDLKDRNINIETKYLVDKRPDNVLYLPLIKQLFPNAKVIFTKRDVLDNALSGYFQFMGPSFSYTNDIGDFVHYEQQVQTLIADFMHKYPNDSYLINYEQLVQSPETELNQVLRFLNLEWQSQCLEFYRSKDFVKTASMAQVRQPLYTSSVGRAHDYRALLQRFDLP